MIIPLWPAKTPDDIRRLASIRPPVMSVNFRGHGPIHFQPKGASARGRLQVIYRQRPLSLIQELRDCYEFRHGDTISFSLPDEVFAKYPNRDVVAPAGLRWRFAKRPDEVDHGPSVTFTAELLQVI